MERQIEISDLAMSQVEAEKAMQAIAVLVQYHKKNAGNLPDIFIADAMTTMEAIHRTIGRLLAASSKLAQKGQA